jgi:prepilin-type N-terminal cleavage/methylation domain-containing protein
MRKTKGYSLVEILVVVIIITIASTVAVINFGPAIVGLNVDNVAADMAVATFLVKREARRGVSDSSKRTFSLKKADIKPHNGILITTQAVNDSRGGCQSNCGQQSVICISGQPFCYNPTDTFTFEQYSGRLTENHIIFILSNKRRLALLLNQNGDYDIAELINGQWRSRTDLQQLFKKIQTNG